MKALHQIIRALLRLAGTAGEKKSLYPASADAGSATNSYLYNNPNFPHYITEIINGDGVPVTQNYYDDSGRLTSMVDANGNTTRFIHNLTNDTEVVIDRLGRTNTAVYDTRGNVTATTNALNQVVLMGYDGNNNKTNQVVFANGQPYATNNFAYDPATLLLTASTDPLGHTSSFAYNSFGQLTQSTDANNNPTLNFYDPNTGDFLGTSDALGEATTNFYSGGLLIGSRDAAGTLTTNVYDASGNLTTSVATSASGTILSSNVFAYDANGNRTNSTVWRKVNGSWTSAKTTYILDAQNRVVQTIEPDGSTNGVVFDPTGKQLSTTDKLGRITSYAYDFAGRLIQTTYPDNSTETFAYDAAGNRTNSVDRLNRTTTYVFDALNRLVQTSYPDSTSTRTVYDDLGRVQFSVSARGITNAFGYDLDGHQVSATNGLGTAAQLVSTFGFDANGNQLYFTNAAGAVTTNVFDALNRQVQVLYPDGTKASSGFDAAGRHVADTNQDGIVTFFGYDGAGQMIAVTNALGKTEQTVTRYDYDETGSLIHQIDALGRTNTFAYDNLGRRILHTLPGGQSEGFAYDLLGNLIYQTNFNGAVTTNQYDVMNRLTNVLSVNGYKVSFGYSVTGQRTSMADASGTTSYTYDNRDRLTQKVVSWTAGPVLSLNYRFDADGNLTNLWSGSSGGVTNVYQFDALDRLTNVLANGSAAAGYGFDSVGNLQTMRYGNGVTNQFQYDRLNRLTNEVWKLNASTLASFYYQLGLTGNHTNLSETVNGTSRTYGWTYDSIYRLKQETLGGGTSGTLSYGFDPVGNRTNRTVSGLSLTNQAFTFGTNDWLTGDQYDSNGNTTNSSGNFYQFDALNHLTNVNSGTVRIVYDGDGNRVAKTVGSTTTYYLLDDRNPSGYVQVLEEWTASGGTTNLSRVYNYGYALISQRQPGVSTNYFVFDGHGSTRVLADIGGSVVNVFAFDAWGNLIASNAAPQTAYLYGGQQFDGDLNQYYLRQRIFNPGTGRFFTADKADGDTDDPRTLHRYIFGADDPVGNVDPEGESFIGFDGTANWEGETYDGTPAPTNVKKLDYASLDPHHWYYRGVGNPKEFHGLSKGLGQTFGRGMSRILKRAMKQLINDRDNHDTTVDIIGFSRGGIEAVEFANRVHDQFPDETIRFVGLFDPVGSVGHPGGFGSYRHDLPAGIGKAVEAFAADENRSWFPGTAVGGAAITKFRGAHSDIGGGFADHGLSDVTLEWMAAQAQSVGIQLDLNRSVIATGIKIEPNANGTIHHVGGITSIFTSGSRTVISDVGSYTMTDYIGN